jgi:hypothetical protein
MPSSSLYRCNHDAAQFGPRPQRIAANSIVSVSQQDARTRLGVALASRR